MRPEARVADAMARMTIELPERFDFSAELAVRVGDINYGGHLGNDALLSLLQEARLQFLRQHGFSEADAGGAGLIMTDAQVEYRAQAFRGDRLRIEVAAAEPSRCGLALCYRATRLGDGAEIARARTGMVFFDYARQKIARMPEAFRAKVMDPACPQAGGE